MVSPTSKVGLRPSSDRAAAISAVSLFAGMFMLTGTHLPYFPLWLEHNGFNESQIATILGVPMFLRIISLPLVTALADRVGLMVMMVLCSIGTTLACLGFLVLDGYAATLFFSCMLIVLLAPMNALADAIVGLTVQTRPNLVYGRIRGFGSVTFMLANVLVGWSLSYIAQSWIVVIMLAAAIGASLALWPASQHLVTSAKRMDVSLRSDGTFKATYIVIGAIILASALIQSSHAYIYAFGSIEWRRQGIGDTAIGIAWATGVAAEIVLFYVLGTRIRTSAAAATLILVGGLGAAFRWSIYAHPLPAEAWPLVQMLHAISFGATHLGSVTLINQLVPEDRRGLAQGIHASVIGAMFAIATIFSDDVYIRFAAEGYYVAALMAGLGMITAIYPWRKLQPQSAASGGNTVPPS